MSIPEIIDDLEKKKRSFRFAALLKICREFFGEPRRSGSHHVFRTPWPGDPRLNLQSDKGKAKPYQVDQVIDALRKLDSMSTR